MFPTTEHDASSIRTATESEGVAGFFAAAEFGPLGGRTYVHSLSASMLAFYPSDGPRRDEVARREPRGNSSSPPFEAPDDISELLE